MMIVINFKNISMYTKRKHEKRMLKSYIKEIKTKNNYNTSIRADYMTDYIKKELEKRGFKVVEFSDYCKIIL